MSCEFCAGSFRGDVVFENEDALVVLHEDWAVPGHAMVVCRRHVENVSDLTGEEWRRLSAVYKRAERVLLEATQGDRAIVMKLGIATPHLHLHIYPVSATLGRTEVMAIIEGKTRQPRDESLVRRLRERLSEGQEDEG